MPILSTVVALCDQMPAFLIGPLAGRPWWMPKAGVSRGQLLLAGLASGSTLRSVRILSYVGGQFDSNELGARVWDDLDVLMAPAGWTSTALTGTAIPLVAGTVVVCVRDIGSAANITVPVVLAAYECFVSSGVDAQAQKVQPDGTLGPLEPLPNGVVGGPEYVWKNGVGTGLIAHPGVELWGGQMWPESAPKQ